MKFFTASVLGLVIGLFIGLATSTVESPEPLSAAHPTPSSKSEETPFDQRNSPTLNAPMSVPPEMVMINPEYLRLLDHSIINEAGSINKKLISTLHLSSDETQLVLSELSEILRLTSNGLFAHSKRDPYDPNCIIVPQKSINIDLLMDDFSRKMVGRIGLISNRILEILVRQSLELISSNIFKIKRKQNATEAGASPQYLIESTAPDGKIKKIKIPKYMYDESIFQSASFTQDSTSKSISAKAILVAEPNKIQRWIKSMQALKAMTNRIGEITWKAAPNQRSRPEPLSMNDDNWH